MPRSKLTVEELKAAAMLLGDKWWYDPHDHSFCLNNEQGVYIQALCADTMEQLYLEKFHPSFTDRQNAILAGELGAADHDEWEQRNQPSKVPYHG